VFLLLFSLVTVNIKKQNDNWALQERKPFLWLKQSWDRTGLTPYCYNTLSGMIIQPARTKNITDLLVCAWEQTSSAVKFLSIFSLTDTELLLLENLLRGVFHKDSKEKGDITTTAAVFDTAVVNVIDEAVAGSILNSCFWCRWCSCCWWHFKQLSMVSFKQLLLVIFWTAVAGGKAVAGAILNSWRHWCSCYVVTF